MSLSTIELRKILDRHEVPGVSLAVTRDFHLVYAQCEGVISNENQRPIWPDSIFQAASISKTVCAIMCMQLCEQGLLSLDTPVNDKLKSWKLPENEWTREIAVTPRHILSHFSGINIPTYRGYIESKKLPTLLDILEGNKNSGLPAIEVENPVDEQFEYSTGAFAVLEMLIEDISNDSFAKLAYRNIFAPLNMHRSFFDQPLPVELHAEAACGHRADGKTVAGNWFTYPATAGSGIWTTPTDLAKLAVHLQAILRGKTEGIISHESACEMLSPYREDFFGLGWAIYNDKGPGVFFGHTGDTEGFRSMFIANKTNGNGAFILVNSDNGDTAVKEIINQIAWAERWEGFNW